MYLESLYEEIRDEYALFLTKKTPIFIFRGTLSKPIVFDFLCFFIEEKIFASILKNIFFIYAQFFIYSPFFPFDLFRRNLTLVLTKGQVSTAHLP